MATVCTYQQFTLTSASLVERISTIPEPVYRDIIVTEYFNGYKHGKATRYSR